MDIQYVETLIKQGESHTLEFKTSMTQLKPALETLCAFLNADGGVVAIGVNDKGGIKGQTITDKTKQEIAFEIGKIEPADHIAVEYVPVDADKIVIILRVNKGAHAPYVYDGRPYQREQSTTHRMTRHKYDQLVSLRYQINFSWESFVSVCDMSDIDHERFRWFTESAVSLNRLPKISLVDSGTKILEKLQLLRDGKLINAAVVLFGKKQLSNYLQCHLKIARFKGLTRKEFLDNQGVYGNAFDLFDAGMAFVDKHLPISAKIDPVSLRRIDKPLIPYGAIREALVNAICHRDYSIYGGAIYLAIYDDRMEIFNHGGLQQGTSLEMIKSGYSQLRNKKIAEVLYKVGYIEQWGRGIQDIISSCVAAGDPEPEFEVQWSNQFKVVFKFPSSIAPPIIFQEDSPNLLTERQKKIISILQQGGGVTKESILTNCSGELSERTLRRELQILKNLNILEVIGRGANARWHLIKE
ncbi:MAG: ATP-binding protein [Gammaproteobacteria bacterium]